MKTDVEAANGRGDEQPIHLGGQTDRQTDRQTDKQTDRQRGRQTDRQTNRHTNRQKTRYFPTRTIIIHSVDEND